MRSVKRGRGFTLIELLAVVVIVGMMLALLLPAEQAARESARSAACASNLRQVIVGVLGFESAQGRLPSGWADPVYLQFTGGAGSWTRRGFIPLLLPHIEQRVLWDSLVTWVEADRTNCAPWSGAHRTIPNPVYTPLSLLLCPSDPTKPIAGRVATSYHCNRGDIWNDAPNNPGDAPKLRRGPFANGTPVGPNLG